MKAAYAYNRRKFLKREIGEGEGLIGQSLRDKDTLYLTEIPEEYINIKSGLGDANPRALLIVPMLVNEEVMGMLELASFEPFPPYKIEFVQKLGESVGSSVASVRNNERTKVLLEDSQEMTEKLRTQEEEMLQNMEELQATYEEMRRTQDEIGRKESNLNALINNTEDSIATIDTNYTIMVINNVIKDRYKGTQYEGVDSGQNMLDYLGSVKDEWKAYYDRAFKGEKLNFTLQSSVRGEDSFREYAIYPIKNAVGEITGASIFSRDVTEQKLQAMENEDLLDALKRKDALVDAVMCHLELDRSGRIVKFNDLTVDTLGIPEEQLLGRPVTELVKESAELESAYRLMQGRQVWNGNLTFTLDGGETRTITLQGTATFNRGEVNKYIMLFVPGGKQATN